jgi:hypothetical protein
VQATWPLVRNGQLIVGTAIGVFASRGTNGGTYSPLGDNLPSVAVYQISLKPGDPNTLVAATYGRGVYTYKFADRSGGGGAGGGKRCRDRKAPRTRFSKSSLHAARHLAGKRLRLGGIVTDRGCGKGKARRKGKVKRVIISIGRQNGRTCRNLLANGRFSKRGSCHKFVYIRARHRGKRWHFTTKRPVPAGTYRIRVKAIDAAGNREHFKARTNTRRIFVG